MSRFAFAKSSPMLERLDRQPLDAILHHRCQLFALDELLRNAAVNQVEPSQ